MIEIMNPLTINVTPDQTIQIDYKSMEDTPIFDICDHDGKLVETGVLEGDMTELFLQSLTSGHYYIFILDGPEILTEQFAISA